LPLIFPYTSSRCHRQCVKAPPNAMVITGCITHYEAGDAGKRMVRFNMGASRLAAHVQVNQKLRTGLKPVVEFDIFVKGGNMLPPLSPVGLAIHAVKIQRQTLAAAATRLGNRTADAIKDAFGVSDD
jgi:hypothetical protein